MKNTLPLRNNSQFVNVYKNGRSKANKYLIIYILENNLPENRLGISVSKKVGNSVIRHRITRIIRECFLSLEGLIPEGYTLVVIARNQAAGKGFSEICGAFKHLLYKSKLISK